MCLITIAFQAHPEYPLIVAANRDEFHSRNTQAAHWWPETPDLLAGKDLEANGTWMGVTRNGLFAAITNVREPGRHVFACNSRGELPKGFLQQKPLPSDFLKELQDSRGNYLGYNLLFGTADCLWFFSNRSEIATLLKPGIHGISNATLNTPWPKVIQTKVALGRLIDENKISTEQLLRLMSSTAEAADEKLPSTGIDLEWERRLSAVRIVGDEYGTRSSTALLISRQGRVRFHELTLAPETEDDVLIDFELE